MRRELGVFELTFALHINKILIYIHSPFINFSFFSLDHPLICTSRSLAADVLLLNR